MIALKDKQNVGAPDLVWPYGKILDNTGSGNGTPVNALNHQDFHQFFESMMAYAGVTANGDLDNGDNGFQLLEALQKAASRRIGERQGGTGDLNNEIYAGIFNVGGAGGSLNRPNGFTEPGQLIISGGGNDLRQRIVEMTTGAEWTRFFNGTWGAWSLTKYARKVIEIGDWNMDTTVSKTVTTGVSHLKIREVSALIKSDSDGYLQPLTTPDFTTQLPSGRIGNIFNTTLTLRRYDGGEFDAAAFSTTPYNRGFVTIIYEP